MTPTTHSLASNPANIALARKLAQLNAYRLPRDPAAIESAAMLGLVRAAERFDETKGVKFPTYATPKIVGAILDEVRQATKGRRPEAAQRVARPVSLDTAMICTNRVDRGMGDRTLSLVETIADGSDDPCDAVDYQDTLESLIRRLPRRGRHGEAIRLLYGEARGVTLLKAARAMGVSESLVCQLRRDALRMMRERLAVQPQYTQ